MSAGEPQMDAEVTSASATTAKATGGTAKATGGTANATTAGEPTWSAAVRWRSYLLLLAILLGGGLLLAWRPLRPSVVPRWLWWFLTGAYGEGFFATAVVLASSMGQDAVDLLLGRRLRALAWVLVLALIGALAGISIYSFQHGRPIVGVIAALMATVGPLARHVFPGLPRARARYRRDRR
jgi:hypothetical protein